MSNSNTVKYEIRGRYITLWVWYRNGKFNKLEVRRGELKRMHFNQLAVWVPPTLKELEQVAKRSAIDYRQVGGRASGQSEFQKYVEAWFAAYQGKHEVEPKFDGSEGKALKGIMKYLGDISENQEAAFGTWTYLLENWHKLDDFYQKNMDLKFINSQLNKIIINLKDVTKEAAGHNAANLRQQL